MGLSLLHEGHGERPFRAEAKAFERLALLALVIFFFGSGGIIV